MTHEHIAHAGGPFLTGQPSVYYNELESRYRETHVERWLRDDAWFSGIAWRELRGDLTEDTMVDGQRHGR